MVLKRRKPNLNGHSKYLTVHVVGDTTIVSTVVGGITFSVHLVPYTEAGLAWRKWRDRQDKKR